MKAEKRKFDKKIANNENGESLLYQGRFVAKSNPASFGDRKSNWKAGTLPTELLPPSQSYFSLKIPSLSNGVVNRPFVRGIDAGK